MVDKRGLAGSVTLVGSSGRFNCSSLRSSSSCAVEDRRIWAGESRMVSELILLPFFDEVGDARRAESRNQALILAN